MANETSLHPFGLNLPIPRTRVTSAQCCARYQVSRTTWWRWTKIPAFRSRCAWDGRYAGILKPSMPS